MSKVYTIKWEAVKDTDYRHTASTKYVSDNFVIWKGKKRVISCLYSANEWHLIRKSDGAELHSSIIAMECRDLLEYAIKKGTDVNTAESLYGFRGIKFDDDFNIIW